MKNVGGIDRILRIVVGVVLVGFGAYGNFVAGAATSTANWIIMAVGAVPLVTGLLNFCPAYSLFGINTCPKK
jgi:hypothetical protein